ncbi:MAG: NUDIX hydrolase [Marinicaulis sp.]|nr:NUDIX hydrolase [Marinicaulis sp.]NNE39313.1 NUDIX hydrolase [Marinicaulis sp.]NNL89915.1 NUDIX hydrolase [Marinicaulis sp.]
MTNSETIRIGVGAVIFRGDEILLIKRGRAPFKGHWSIPGGGVDYGEKLRDAIVREVREETGVEIENLILLDVFEATPDLEGVELHTVMVDYIADWRKGEPVAADDALEAEFVPIETALARLSWDETRTAVAAAVERRSGGSGAVIKGL